LFFQTKAGYLLPFALLLTSAILAVTGIELKDWSCGFTPDQKRFTYELLSGNCSKYKYKSYEQVVPQGMDHGVARNLYQQCEHAAYTTRACAVNHNSCSLGAHDCQKDFKDCMECIRIVQEDHDCSAALDSLPAGG
ncbi:hypothetical protein OESDEN_25147, partial [Oesophagostomum dentatum]